LRDNNKIVTILGIRLKELDSLINELNFITKNSLGENVEIDLSNLTVMGHGFGATTAIVMASKDQRVKKVVSLDPWLTPLKEEIENDKILLSQPHCSINSELFHMNLGENWELLTHLFDNKNMIKASNKNLLCLLNNVGHMAFTDLSLILLLELRLVMFTPSFSQIFRGQYNLKIIVDVTRAFFI
jgi:hypothetical protein